MFFESGIVWEESDHRMMVAFFCKDATKKIFFAFCIKVSNSNGITVWCPYKHFLFFRLVHQGIPHFFGYHLE